MSDSPAHDGEHLPPAGASSQQANDLVCPHGVGQSYFNTWCTPCAFGDLFKPIARHFKRKGGTVKRIALFCAFVLTVVAANWALTKWGIVPIGFGLMAPAGVYFAGAAFGLRDALHEVGGHRWVLGAIAAGAAVSYFIEDAVTIPGGMVPIAVASALAFALSELADFAVYTPLRERRWALGVVASNAVGAVIDSLLFLPLAFGSRSGWIDLTIGKLYLVLPAVVLVGWLRRKRQAPELVPALG